MDETSKTYRAILFDLDGTLLPMDIDEFMNEYFKRIGEYAAAQGWDAPVFMDALNAGVKAMMSHTDDKTNDDTFWDAFTSVYGSQATELQIRTRVADFYENYFGHIGDGFVGSPLVPHIIETLTEKGYPIVLATMPLFPLRALQWRLSWAGIDDSSVFARITSYENSKTAKPRLDYYAEVLAAIGAHADEVLMVGNNTQEDFSCLKMGIDGYLITDFLLNPIDLDVDSMRHGSMEEFSAWVDALPDCTDPLENISTGIVDYADIERVLAENTPQD